MYHVLLVDDEPTHLAGLSKLLHRIRPEYTIHTARNGMEALRAYEAGNYQIIISDIEMPVMDGLEFIDRLNGRGEPLRIIFLTGYNHFEYAQKAIRLGSFEYVLKPVDVPNFTAVLERAEHSLEQEIRGIQAHARLETMLQSTMPVYRSRILYDWLKGVPLRQEACVELRSLELDRAGFLLVTDLKMQSDSSQAENWKEAYQQPLERLLRRHGACYSFVPDSDAGQLLTLSGAKPGGALLSELAGLMEALDTSGYTVTVGISAWGESLAEEGPQHYREALLACNTGFYAEVLRPIKADEARIDPNFILIPVPKEEALLSDAVFGEAANHPEAVITRWFERLLRAERYPMPRELSRYVQELLCQLILSADFLNKNIREELIMKVRSSLDCQPRLSCFRKETAKLVAEIATAAKKSRREHKETLIYRCLAYIDEHYMEDLSLETVAAVFHFKSTYFSHYFKNKLNINFSQYLTQVRLTKAKEFLLNGDEKVYQIAARLGYHDVKYFNRVFKKEMGLTPEEYRSIARDMRRIEKSG